jgi:hypothetical protein
LFPGQVCFHSASGIGSNGQSKKGGTEVPPFHS